MFYMNNYFFPRKCTVNKKPNNLAFSISSYSFWSIITKVVEMWVVFQLCVCLLDINKKLFVFKILRFWRHQVA